MSQRRCFFSAAATAFLLLAFAGLVNARQVSPQKASQVSPSIENSEIPQASEAEGPVTPPSETVISYTLPPKLYRKARELGRIFFWFDVIAGLYGLAILWLILHWKIAPKYRSWAERAISNRAAQVVIFAPLLLFTVDVFSLPVGIFENWELRKYGLSVQGWISWASDWGKEEILLLIGGTILVAIFYAIVRKSPRRWWLYFWLAILPIATFMIFLEPLVVDPLFHKFEPLQQKDPALTAALEKMIHRAGQNIPPERIYWMGASAKSNELNAYVTGLGGSKRIVVWDTTIAKMTTPQIVFVVGHEMGHYVLHHVPKEAGLLALGLLVIFYLGYLWIGWVLRRWGEGWEIRGVADWASLPALLLLLGIFSFVGNPAANAVSRHFEHQADQYGLEVTHGLTPNSGEVAARAFETLGVVDLSDPRPGAADIILTYDHPSIPARIRFALTYDPWALGGRGEFVH